MALCFFVTLTVSILKIAEPIESNMCLLYPSKEDVNDWRFLRKGKQETLKQNISKP